VSNLFAGRRLYIATQHHKDQVIAPILSAELGVTCEVTRIDTDSLGTFSGEIERLDDPITTLRHKCELALQDPQVDLVIASEGSFGPHPRLFFMPADDEWLMLKDTRYGLEVTARYLSTETNFAASAFSTWAELEAFAKTAGFPSHGLILRPAKDQYQPMFKGIVDKPSLQRAFDQLIIDFSQGYVETDMRAMHNPQRMQVIAKATAQLVLKLNSPCPQCAMPGFDLVRVNPGLPCEQCGMPTQSALSHIYGCHHCDFEEQRLYPKDKQYEEARFCPHCNP